MTSTIASASPRRRTTLRGQVVSLVTKESPWLRTDAVLSDGSAQILLRFVGRTSLPGLAVGRRVVVHGTPGIVHGELVMLNPVYSLDDSA